MKSKQFSFLVAWLILFYSSIFCALECSTTSLWQRTLDSSLIEAHQGSAPCLFNEDIKYNKRLLDEYNSENIAVMCKTTKEDNQVSFGEDFYRTYHSKSSEIVCAIAELSHKDIDRYLSTEPNIKIEMLPSYLKVHQTVVEHVFKAGTTLDVDDNRTGKSSEHNSAESLVLTIEFSPMALHRQPSRKLSDELFASFTALRSKDNSATDSPLSAVGDETLAWNAVVKSISNRTTATTCELMPHNAVEVHSHSVSVSDLSGLSLPCLVAMTHIASLSLSVLRITLTTRPELVNFEARGVMQTGYVENEPYSSAGLTGEGQVCGLADSGLNDLSCFLVDDSRGLYAGRVTDRSGVVEMGRRKVVQYTAYADKYDLEGGHGTHVGGSIVGASLSNEFSQMNGVAPDAKLSFLDIGLVDKPFLVMPPVYQLLETAYNASARVHSNSWGSTSSVYGPLSYDADRFLYDHPDSLVVFAAGNSGALGLKSIIAPANAKNALCVGAGQLREAYSDRVLSGSNYSVAQFSSLGPTTDGRIKPDIIAPGDFIMSSYAGPLADLKAAVDRDATAADSSGYRNSSSSGGRNATAEGVHTCCAVHQLSGTSMAAPLVAGTALLIRQFFMDPRFWAALCNPRYSACQEGSFTPTGYLLKTLILHSGNAVSIYGSPLFNAQNVFASFPLGNPPDYFQGYGELLLSNILPLRSGQGLRRDLDLVVLDRMSIKPFSTITIEVDMSGRVVDHGRVANRKKTAAGAVDGIDANDARDSFQSYSSNWGRENRRANDDLLTERRTASNGNGASSAAPPPLKVTISWYDPPSLMGSGSSLLVHDLDLIVETPTGDVYTGNHEGVRFNRHGSDNVNRIVTDESNPNEQVTIVRPECSSPSREDIVGDGADGTTERGRKLSGEKENCVFKVYVQSYAMLEDVTAQNFALVITTGGVVGEPKYSMGTMPIIPLRRPNTAPEADDHRWVRNVPTKKTRDGVPANNTAASTVHDTAARQLAEKLRARNTSSVGGNTSSTVIDHNPVVVRIASGLRGNQFSDAEVKVPPSTDMRLTSVDIDLLFEAELQSGQAANQAITSDFDMRNVSIAVVDPTGAILVVSGSDRPRFEGGVLTRGFVVWPETSNDSTTVKNYTYSARITVKDVESVSFRGLGGNGTWRVVLTNRALFSRTLVQFNLTAAMNFESVDEAGTSTAASRDSNPEKPAPSVSNMPAFASEKIGLGLDSEIVVPLKVSPSYAFSTASQQSVASNKHSSSGSDERVTRTFNLSAVSLGVAASEGDQHALQQDRVLLAAFEQSGVLDSITISLDAYQGGVQSRGLDAWLLAVIVTAPSGLVVQVGGYHWLGQRDRFYDRRWPDVWLGRCPWGRTGCPPEMCTPHSSAPCHLTHHMNTWLL